MSRAALIFVSVVIASALGCSGTPELPKQPEQAGKTEKKGKAGQLERLRSAQGPGLVKRILEDGRTVLCRLDNGLVILCQENHAAPIAVVQGFVRAGSIFEDEYTGSGISHFSEHLVSGGSTPARSEKETERILDSLGGANNAYTSSDRTTYFVRTTTDKFRIACELIADWMQNAAFEPKEVAREHKVIQREIEKGLAEPGRVLWKLAQETMFSFHPARHPVIGHMELFRKITRDDLLKYYRRMYTPDNMIVVAVGDFDASKTADYIAGLFKNARAGGRQTLLPRDDPAQQGMRFAAAEMDVRSAYVLMCFRTVPLSHPDLYPLDVMSYVLSNGRSSRLVQRLRERDRLVDSITTWSYTPWFGAGSFAVRMTLRPENVKRARAAVLEELNKLKSELVTDAEMARAKKQRVADEVLGRQTIESQAAQLGGNYLATGNPFFGKVYLRGIRGATARGVREVARKYLLTDNLTVTIVRPKTTPKAKTEATERTAPPSKIEKTVLPNGLRILVKRNPNVPIVSIQAYFLGGVLREDERTAGTSRALGRMLTRGTKTRSALEISKAFDDMAGSIGGGSGNNTFFLNAQVLSEDFEKAFEIFADCLVSPTFPDKELGNVKRLALNAIARQNDDSNQEAYNLMRKTLYKVSPYRLNPLGTAESVKAITREALAAYHKRACAGRNGVVAIFGDVDAGKAKALAARLLGRLPAGEASALEVPGDPPLERDMVARKKSGRPQTAAVYAAYPACDMGNVKDRYPLLVLDGVMSGVGWPGGWLHNELRGKGLVYVVHAYNFLGFRMPGYFGIYAVTRPEKVGEVIGIINKNIERAKSGLVPKDEFERAKSMAVTVELLGRQTNSSLAAQAALDELYGLGYDFSERFAERVKRVTRAEVLRVARKYLTKRALAIVSPAAKEP